MSAATGPTFLRRLLRPSTARRLGSWVLLGSIAVLAASMGFVMHGARESVLARSSEAMRTLATSAANTLAARTSGLETSARVVAATIGGQLDNPDFIERILQTIASAHVEVASLVAAFEPGVIPGKQSQYAPFYAHSGDTFVHRDLADDPGDYRDSQWYQRAAACPQGCWGRPFHSHSRDQLLINFGVPIVDASGRRVGVLNVDVPQQWLQDAVNAIELGPASFGYVLSEDGIFLASPNASSIAISIFDRARTSGTPELAQIAKRMMAGETGTQDYKSPTLRARVQTFFTQVPNSHWSLAIVVPEDHFFHDANKIFLDSALVGLIGFAVLGLFIWLAVRRMLKPLGLLAAKSEHVARGELDFQLDPPLRMDEVGRLTQSFIGMRDELKQHIAELTEATAARERLQSELEIAQHIQESMLPRDHCKSGGAYPFELQALLRPAKVVGGDLYSYVSGDDRLCFLIGDVSDKGIPAALFMARTITAANAHATGTTRPDDLLRQLNLELCTGNDNCMFVTMLCGILDLATGKLALSSAGHDAPIRMRGRATEVISVETGPPLGLEESAAFPTLETQLAAGDCLVLFTDGVTEARDPDDALYGEQRLLAVLERCASHTPGAIIAAVTDDITVFMGDAPLADDLTLLVLRRFGGAAATRDLTIELGAQLAEVGDALDRIEAWLHAHRVSTGKTVDVRVALEELMVNTVRYGFPDETPTRQLCVELRFDGEALIANISDNGIAHDPFARQAPDLDADHDNRPIGGLGVHLVTQLAQTFAYRREGDFNRVDLRFDASLDRETKE